MPPNKTKLPLLLKENRLANSEKSRAAKEDTTICSRHGDALEVAVANGFILTAPRKSGF
jgi:hypothetical protein